MVSSSIIYHRLYTIYIGLIGITLHVMLLGHHQHIRRVYLYGRNDQNLS